MQFNLGENRKFETHLIPLLMGSMVRVATSIFIFMAMITTQKTALAFVILCMSKTLPWRIWQC
ncbi:MAG: hypothetical protein ACKO46_02815, partial [Alphaproteobacteria bacterium]